MPLVVQLYREKKDFVPVVQRERERQKERERGGRWIVPLIVRTVGLWCKPLPNKG